jgi:hypothetical protein
MKNLTSPLLLVILSGFSMLLCCAVRTPGQDIEASATIDAGTAASFCKDLREAVRAQDRTKISGWIRNFPIEVQRDSKNILVEDNADFVRKFDLIFDAALKTSLFAPTGCESKPHPVGDAGLAGDQIVLTQIEGEAEPYIGAISPPADTDPIAYTASDQYEKRAQVFFTKLQQALGADNKIAVASMCMYPIHVCINGNFVTIRSRAELIRHYSQIFTPAVKKAVAALPSPIHLGWKGFMTDHGELWLDGVVWTHVYRVRSVCGGP